MQMNITANKMHKVQFTNAYVNIPTHNYSDNICPYGEEVVQTEVHLQGLSRQTLTLAPINISNKYVYSNVVTVSRPYLEVWAYSLILD